jgi:hypothetical protein
MTRKDYRLIAAALQAEYPTGAPYDSPAANAWWAIVRGIAASLAGDNPRFIMDRFIQACQP